MTSVVLATSSDDLARRVRVAVGEEVLVFPPDQLPADPSQVLALAGEDPAAVEVVVLEPAEGRADDALRLAARFDQRYPRVSVLLVTDQKAELALAAMRSGVRDLLYRDATVGDIRWAVERAREGGSPRPRGDAGPTVSGRVVLVSGPKGGVGKTMLASNLAVGLTRHAPHGTVLVDLNLQFGDLTAVLGLRPEASIADAAARVADGEDGATLHGLLTRHRSGLQVLCAAASPAEADDIAPEHVGTVLALLKSEFQYVVVDTPPGLSEHTVAALEHVDDLVLVTGSDVPSVRALIKELQVLDSLDLSCTRHLVLNTLQRRGGVTREDVQAAVGRPVDVVVPRSSGESQASGERVLLIESQGRDPAGAAVARLVGRFSPEEEERSGLWRRLARRSGR